MLLKGRQGVFPSKTSIQLPNTSLICPSSQAQITYTYRAAAMSIYMTNLPFNHFGNSYVIVHHQALNPGYKPPHYKLVEGKLLNEAYETVGFKVIQELNAYNYLRFFTDETTNIRRERVIDFCCHVYSLSPSITNEQRKKGIHNFELRI